MIIKQNKIEFFLATLFILLPILFITGPALPDICISLCALYFLIKSIINKEFGYVKNNIFIFFIIFWCSAVISSLLSDHIYFSLSSSLPYIRFIFFVFFVESVVSNFNFVKKYIFGIIYFVILFTALDTYLQYFYGTEIFGHEIDLQNEVRLTGPFPSKPGDQEQIVGSYITTFLFIALAFIIYSTHKNKYFKYTIFASFLIFYFAILISGERMAFILANFGLFIFILFNLKLIWKLIPVVILGLFIMFLIIQNNPKVQGRMFSSTLDILGLSFQNKEIVKNEHDTVHNTKKFRDSHYGAHYLTAFSIFKDNKVLGSGTKTFRIVCANEKYENIDSLNIHKRCSTHPHNYYLQILSENGIIGFLSFILFVTSILIFSFKNLDRYNYFNVGCFISLILFIWPLKSTGSIYNNWYGAILFYLISLIFLLKKYKSDN